MANKMYALVGPHAAGKSLFARRLRSEGIHYIPYYTTQPQEKDLSAKGDVKSIMCQRTDKTAFFKTEFICKDTYKGDYYGFAKSDVLNAINNHPISVCILTPEGMRQLSKLMKESLESIYLMSDYVTLVERMLRHGHTNDEIKYHLEYAENNGELILWKTANHVVKNSGAADVTFNQIMAIMGLMQRIPQSELDRRIGH